MPSAFGEPDLVEQPPPAPQRLPGEQPANSAGNSTFS